MSYIQAVNIIKGVSEAINPDGIFVHGRTWDASLEFSNLDIQIYLYPFTGNVDVNNSYYETYQITMGFYFQDTQDSTNEDRQALIQRADNLTRDFLNTLNVVEGVEVSGSRVEPSYRQMAGTYTGYILSFTLGIDTNTCGGDVEPDIPALETFCEKVDDCLNIPTSNGNYMLKILDGVKSWVIATASAAWGTITGTITDQTDLVNYITTRLTGYATEAFVTSQGYITNVITSLGYTPENVANKTATISGNESSTTLYPNVKGVVDWIKQGMTGLLSSLSLTKTTPVGEDSLLINDSADSDKLKLFSFTNLIAYLRGFFVSNLFVSTADYSTSSTSEVLLKSELIPAGTIGVGKLLTIAPRYIKAGGSGTVQATIRIHTSSVAGAGNQLTGGSFAAGTRHIHYHKIGAVKSTTDTLFGATGIVDDYINSTATPVSYNIDWSVDQYVNFCGLVASASDTLFLSSYKITVE